MALLLGVGAVLGGVLQPAAADEHEAPAMPHVESDDPDLEPFPEDPDPDAQAAAGAERDVTLPGRDRNRTVPVALAALGIAGTGGVALREVLLAG